MNEDECIKRQKRAGTHDRNKEIKALYRHGLGEVLGRRFGISRERIRQIRALPSSNHHPKKRRWWQWWVK
ncbi:hypothetical protein ES703_45271 [subsurface metagenome]